MTSALETLLSRRRVEDVVVKMFVATDEQDWPTLRSCFTDPFLLDMTSMVGGSPATMTPEQVANAWSAGFKPLNQIHHQVGNFRSSVNGTSAVVQCYGVALHYRAGISAEDKTRRFVGTYDLDLTLSGDDWRINRLKFNLKFIDGNLDLENAT